MVTQVVHVFKCLLLLGVSRTLRSLQDSHISRHDLLKQKPYHSFPVPIPLVSSIWRIDKHENGVSCSPPALRTSDAGRIDPSSCSVPKSMRCILVPHRAKHFGTVDVIPIDILFFCQLCNCKSFPVSTKHLPSDCT